MIRSIQGHLGSTFADDLRRCTGVHVMIAVPYGGQVLRAMGDRPPDPPRDQPPNQPPDQPVE